jgi:hypothetical protein
MGVAMAHHFFWFLRLPAVPPIPAPKSYFTQHVRFSLIDKMAQSGITTERGFVTAGPAEFPERARRISQKVSAALWRSPDVCLFAELRNINLLRRRDGADSRASNVAAASHIPRDDQPWDPKV